MSQAYEYESSAAARRDPLRPTPDTGRHAILPGVGLSEPNVIARLAMEPSISPEQPDLDIPGRLPEDNPGLIRRTAAPVEDVETSLSRLIAECHFYMSEVAFRCTIQSSGVEDRLAFMRAAMSCAETGANVARAVAKLRKAPLDEEAMIAKTLMKAKLLGPEKKTESEKQ